MSTAFPRILKSIFLPSAVLLPMLVHAQDCAKNLDATYDQARAVLRAHNCEKAATATECEMHLGVGKAAGAFLVAGLAGRTAMNLRDPEFGVCALASRSLWIETAYAAKACIPSEHALKIRLGFENNRMIEKYEKALSTQKAAIEKVKKQMSAPAAAKADLEAAVQKADADLVEAKVKAASLPRAVETSSIEYKGLIANTESLLKKHLNRTGTSDAILHQLKDPVWRKKMGLTDDAAQEIVDSYEKTLLAGKEHKNLKVQLEGIAADIKAKEGVALETRKKAEAFSQVKVTPSKQQEVLKQSLARLEADQKSLETNRQVLEELKGVLSGGKQTSIAEIQQAALMLKETGAVGDQLALSQLVAQTEKLAPNSRIKAHGFPGNAKAMSLKGTIVKGALGAAAIGSAGIAGASETTVNNLGDLTDPISMALHTNARHCKDEIGMNKSAAFPPLTSNDCKPDFSINAESAKILNASKDELKTMLEQDPGVCEFIQWNHRQYFGFTKASCTAEGVTVQLRDGMNYRVTDRKISYFQEATTKFPVEIELDDKGNETVVRRPRVGGRNGQANGLVTDLSKLNSKMREENLAEVYGKHRGALGEAKSCCSSEGVRPTSQECARYGITGSSGESGAAGAAGTR